MTTTAAAEQVLAANPGDEDGPRRSTRWRGRRTARKRWKRRLLPAGRRRWRKLRALPESPRVPQAAYFLGAALTRSALPRGRSPAWRRPPPGQAPRRASALRPGLELRELGAGSRRGRVERLAADHPEGTLCRRGALLAGEQFLAKKNAAAAERYRKAAATKPARPAHRWRCSSAPRFTTRRLPHGGAAFGQAAEAARQIRTRPRRRSGLARRSAKRATEASEAVLRPLPGEGARRRAGRRRPLAWRARRWPPTMPPEQSPISSAACRRRRESWRRSCSSASVRR